MSAKRLESIEHQGVTVRAGSRYRIADHHNPGYSRITVSNITKKAGGIVIHYRRKHKKLHNSIRLNQVCGILENWTDY